MARRFGDRYSPSDIPKADARTKSGGDRWQGKRRARHGARLNALFIAPFPLVLFAFGQDPVGLALDLAAFGVLMGAATLTREGVRAEEAFEARKVARRPALPRKIMGSALTGIGLALAAAGAGSLAGPIVLGVLGAVLHVMAFGPDPMRDKGVAGGDTFETERVARAVDEAEGHLARMQAALAPLGDRTLEDRLARFSDTARRMFRRVEEDPRDLSGARRWLGVYLLGARDATVKFADLYARNRDPEVRKDYILLLDDLEEGFARRTETMLLDDRSDLDVEIEVLRDRLARDGVLAQRKT
ncbi:5-bromo-4-chloroindolyl phosphate hydrolysis protein [Palleronia aestuarii]|uniref:5-bromo-4-chloroindolyl phosphate hydrolysis protein n=1 Tax=Palleronia aestuarii TaxID=568105 RepID=A0A2W7P2W8_9RHOB|nr:5-bromo-4-chloroindolyl phosphate hydrolysis family protein [Palleronia aestuarii]PZX17772.1 5-bromo-4-chloroindolyl phosphate hydrolysis protein [Palleronia aestuarii]